LLESNLRFLADRELEAQGLTSKTDKAHLLVSKGYEFDFCRYGCELLALTLYVSLADNNERVWRGMAKGASGPTPPPAH